MPPNTLQMAVFVFGGVTVGVLDLASLVLAPAWLSLPIVLTSGIVLVELLLLARPDVFAGRGAT